MKTRVFAGLTIKIDRPKGFVQEGKDKEGKPWKRVYKCDYGYIPRTDGGDGEGLDVFLGPDEGSRDAYWAVQHKDDGSFDEYKVMLGCESFKEARRIYTEHIPAKYLGGLFVMSVDMMKSLLGVKPAEKVAGFLGFFEMTAKLAEEEMLTQLLLQAVADQEFEKMAAEVRPLIAELPEEEREKLALRIGGCVRMGRFGGNELWAEQFIHTPFFDEARKIEERDLALQMKEDKQEEAERVRWHEQRQIGMEKTKLEIQLLKHRHDEAKKFELKHAAAAPSVKIPSIRSSSVPAVTGPRVAPTPSQQVAKVPSLSTPEVKSPSASIATPAAPAPSGVQPQVRPASQAVPAQQPPAQPPPVQAPAPGAPGAGATSATPAPAAAPAAPAKPSGIGGWWGGLSDSHKNTILSGAIPAAMTLVTGGSVGDALQQGVTGAGTAMVMGKAMSAGAPPPSAATPAAQTQAAQQAPQVKQSAVDMLLASRGLLAGG